MAFNVDDMKKHFTEDFDPRGYCEMIQAAFQDKNNFMKLLLEDVFNIFRSRRFEGIKLLEIGSGPTIHNLAIASAFFPHIVVSDFVDANCNEVKKWLNNDPDALDWNIFLSYIAELEGSSDIETGIEAIAARSRAAVKSVVHCDVLEDHVLPPEEETEYDAIFSSLTLEAAAPDVATLVAIFKRLNRLLRTGGGLIMVGCIKGEEKWRVGENQFPYLSLERDEIADALREAGFRKFEWKLRDKVEESEQNVKYKYDFKECYVLASEKL